MCQGRFVPGMKKGDRFAHLLSSGTLQRKVPNVGKGKLTCNLETMLRAR